MPVVDRARSLVKRSLKMLAAQPPIETYQRLLAYSILKREFEGLRSAPSFENRECLWRECLRTQFKEDARITYVEFGVYEGASIRRFSEMNRNPDSRFFGLDSFEGLPEEWAGLPKGTYSAHSRIPDIDDRRVSFIKGLFQDTWEELRARLGNAQNLIVHYDADLYSSTLFALSAMDVFKTGYIAIFDEFIGHEARALYNYRQAYNASVAFLGKTVVNRYPWQIMCRITPKSPASLGHCAD
jgi:hypothetical protein